MKRFFAASILAMNMVIAVNASAAGKYNIGFSDTFVVSYMNSIGKYCTSPSTQICPDNFVQTDYNGIAYLLYDLATNQHVGAYREVLPINMIYNEDGTSNFPDILRIMEVYSAYNLNLTISFGLPLPQYMAVNGNNFSIMPYDDASWNTLNNTITAVELTLVANMWADPNINQQWMASRLLIEPFNEFDAISNLAGYPDSSTPQRAAQLQNSVQYYLNYYGYPVRTTSPSIVGSQSSDGVRHFINQTISAYYASGGGGKPNVHLYIPGANTSADVLNTMRGELYGSNGSDGIVGAIPASLQGQLVISESGSSTVTPGYCNSSAYFPALSPDQKQYELAAIASDSYINQSTETLLFWRTMTLDPSRLRANEPACEAFFGVATYNGAGYTQAGINLFNYLRQ